MFPFACKAGVRLEQSLGVGGEARESSPKRLRASRGALQTLWFSQLVFPGFFFKGLSAFVHFICEMSYLPRWIACCWNPA